MVTIQDKDLNQKEDSRWSKIISNDLITKRDSRVSRKSYQQSSKQEQKINKTGKRNLTNDGRFSVRLRLIPIWLRLVIIVVVSVIAAFVGAYFGYVILGDGKSSEVFSQSTWQHIFDLVNKAK
ncbi:MAG: hydroxymyristoyl-ACP dehydratase [Bacillales bacterium]|jgi:hypothetical protein|nr:hydroxymyristoyl-ACP dehydratase [Bacillales bacterium]